MIYVITLCFNRTAMMKASLQRFWETFGIPESQYTHVFVDQHYPRDREETLAWLEELKARGNSIVVDPGENLGLQRGVNFALSKIALQPNDIVFFYDPDMFPLTPNWGTAMRTVFQDDRFWWLSSYNCHTERETTERGFDDMEVFGHRIRKTHCAVVNSVSALRGEFLLKIGGAHEPNPFYGGFEIAMYAKLMEQMKWWGFLRDFHEDVCPMDLVDQDYKTWKWETCHGALRGKQEEFGKWLKDTGKL